MIKHMRHIILLHFLSLCCILTGCNSEIINDNEINVPIPHGGYIHFGYDDNVSRASNLVETMTEKNFNVIAFKYQGSTTWDNYKTTGKPTSGVTEFPFPTEVTYADNMWSYDASSTTENQTQLVPWSSTSKYAFFAYYPQSLTQTTDENTANTPGVSYSIDPSNTNPQALSDVMRASEKDVENTGNGVVNFTFKHCLSCITFEARNFDEVESTATDQEKEEKKQYIKGLNVYLTSKMYRQLSIPLDVDIVATPSGIQDGNLHYVITTNDDAGKTEIPALVKGNQIEVIDVAKGNNVFIIPQNPEGLDGIEDNADDMGDLEGYVEFYCKDKNGNDAFRTGDIRRDTGDKDSTPYRSELAFSSDKTFEAGRRYSLVINFTSNAQISIAIIESGDWTDANQDITFE